MALLWKKWTVWLIIAAGIIGIVYYGIHQLMPRDYSLTGLHPEVEKATEQLMEKVKERGIEILITEGFRSWQEQDDLYQQGRSLPGKVVTYAQGGESYHNYGLAIDFALYNSATEEASWDLEQDHNENGIADWDEVVIEAKALGFSWGGDWTGFPDYPHLQMTFGQPIWLLKVKTQGISSLWE